MNQIKSAHPVKAERRNGQVVLTFHGVEHRPMPTWTFVELMQKCLPILQAIERENWE